MGTPGSEASKSTPSRYPPEMPTELDWVRKTSSPPEERAKLCASPGLPKVWNWSKVTKPCAGMIVLAGMRYLSRPLAESVRYQPETSMGAAVVFFSSIQSLAPSELAETSLTTTAPFESVSSIPGVPRMALEACQLVEVLQLEAGAL